MDLKQYHRLAVEYAPLENGAAGRLVARCVSLGNGHLGAMPYGRLCEERVLINHERLWFEGIIPELPDLSHLLAKSRKLIEQGDVLAANELYWDALESQGKEGECAVYHPAADLTLNSICEERFKNYQRYLDFEAGETLTYWEWHGTPQARRSFVSRADDCIVLSQLGSGLQSLEWELKLELHELMDAIYPDGELFEPPIDFTSSADGEWLTGIGRYTDPNYDGAEYGVVAPVIGSGAAELRVGACGQSLVVQGADELLVIAKVFVYEPAEPAVERLQQEIQALGTDYRELRAHHVELHGPRFNSCRVDLTGSMETHTTNEALFAGRLQRIDLDGNAAENGRLWPLPTARQCRPALRPIQSAGYLERRLRATLGLLLHDQREFVDELLGSPAGRDECCGAGRV